MEAAELVRHLEECGAYLAQEFGVLHLAMLDRRPPTHVGQDGDLTVLIRFDGPANIRRYFGVQFHLENVLGRPVRLVADEAPRRARDPEWRESVRV